MYKIDIHYLACLYGRPILVLHKEYWGRLKYQTTIKTKQVDLKAAKRYI